MTPVFLSQLLVSARGDSVSLDGLFSIEFLFKAFSHPQMVVITCG